MYTKTCEQCGNTFEKPYTCSFADWEKRRFCKTSCKNESQKGKPAWNRGKHSPSKAKKVPCRICGQPTKTNGTERSWFYDLLHCGRPECAEASRKLKNERIGQKAAEMYANGERKARRDGWKNVPLVSKEENTISPWLESLGWIPQYKFLTGVHTNKLPRMFRLDFAMPDLKLYIEIDGSVHRLRKDRDARRDKMMTDRGWTALRIDAKLVQSDIESVKQKIVTFINS